MKFAFQKPSAREVLALIVIVGLSYLWWAEHRSHVATQRQLKSFQGWSVDLSETIRQERDLARQREEETRTWTAKSLDDEDDPFGK
jgi:cytoskeletal protein RodZ